MDIALIVGGIDAEIKRLKRIRAIVEALLQPKTRAVAKARPVPVERIARPELKPEPQMVVLPPKRRREYTRRVKPRSVESKALAAPVSSRPVFVPKGALPQQPTPKLAATQESLEAVIRHKLLRGVA